MKNNKITFLKNYTLDNYNKLLEQTKLIFINDIELIDSFINIENDEKLLNINNFYNSLEEELLFNLFIEKRIKVFSSKNRNTKELSRSLFGNNLSLKNIFNNQPDNIKSILWNYLHMIYLTYASLKEEHKNRIEILENIYKTTKNEILDLDVNNSTNNMINDIITSFEDKINTNSSNPINSIMEITEMITEKYNDQIDNGEIEIDRLLNDMTSNMPDINNLVKNMQSEKKPKEKFIMDENFSTDQVELGDKDKPNGPNINQMFQMFNKLSNLNENGLGGLKDLLNNPNENNLNENNLNENNLEENNLDENNLDENEELNLDEEKLNEIKESMDDFFKNNLGINMNELLNKPN